MNKMTGKIVRAFVIVICIGALLLFGYYKLSKYNPADTDPSAQMPSSEVEKLKRKDLENAYPGTPSEVVKLYWRLNKCLYNDGVGEKDFQELLQQLRILYDEELLAEEQNEWDNMLNNFQKDIKSFKNKNRVLSSYTVEKNSAVEQVKVDGRECATVLSSVFETVKAGNPTIVYEEFMCRRDEEGRWKIVGWQVTDEELE